MRSNNIRLPCEQPPTSLCTTSNFLVYNIELPHITSKCTIPDLLMVAMISAVALVMVVIVVMGRKYKTDIST